VVIDVPGIAAAMNGASEEGGGGGRVRILFASRQALFRQAVRAALDGESGFEVVMDTGDSAQALSGARRLRPEVAMIDEDLNGTDGMEIAREIKQFLPDCSVLVLSGNGDHDGLLRAVEAGVNGYLKKESSLIELLSATRALQRGEMVVPPSMLRPLVDDLLRRRREKEDALRHLAKLTNREREVLSFLVTGADNDAIARELVISPETARTHIQHILAKLGVHSRLEAAAFVMRNRIDEAQPLI
jgi:DNA-binding NarL/FixJ family response regulator